MNDLEPTSAGLTSRIAAVSCHIESMLSSATPRRFSVSLRSRLISLPEQLRLDLPEVAPERVSRDSRDGTVNPAAHLESFLLWLNKRSS